MTETTATALTGIEFRDNLKLGFHHRDENHLGNPVTRFNRECLMTAVPARYEYLALIVRIDQSHEIAEHDPVLVAKAGTRQQNGSETRVGNMNGQAGGNELGFSRFQYQWLFQARDHVEARSPVGTIARKGKASADARVEDFECDFFHGT